jgi:hypothetical protein
MDVKEPAFRYMRVEESLPDVAIESRVDLEQI